MSMVNTLVAAVVTALQAAPAVAPRIERVRLRALPATASVAVVVRPLMADVLDAELPTGHPVAWSTRLAVECYARAPQNVAPDVAVDAVLSAVYERLMTDASLGLVTTFIQPQGITYDYDVDGESVVCATLQITARQITVGASLN